jgi:hypothetical protein
MARQVTNDMARQGTKSTQQQSMHERVKDAKLNEQLECESDQLASRWT